MRLPHALLPLLLQACWATAQDFPAADKAIAFQGEWTVPPSDRVSGCRGHRAGTQGGDQMPERGPGPFP